MSVLLETPSDMHHMAAHIRSSADNVRDRAHQLALAAGRTRWHSPAAREFREQVDAVARHMCSAADRLEHAADALDRHARHVHDALTAPAHALRAIGHAVGL